MGHLSVREGCNANKINWMSLGTARAQALGMAHRPDRSSALLLALGVLASGCLEPPARTGAVGTIAAPLEAAADPAAAQAAAALLAATRAGMGLAPLTPDPALGRATSAHATCLVSNADYYAATGLSPHREEPELEGFTGASLGARLAQAGFEGYALGEVIGSHPTAVATMAAWLESLYHRLPLLHPRAARFGLVHVSDGVASADVGVTALPLDLALPPQGALEAAFPPPDAVGVPASWDGRESPQPAPPPEGYPSGPVVTLQLTGEHLAVEVATVARADDADAPLEATVLTAAEDSHVPGDTVAVIPWRPLDGLTTYRVRIVGALDGEPFERVWQFTTRALACDPLTQGCGPGQGCYPTAEGGRCHWAGTAEPGEPCAWINACRAGAVCSGELCRELCPDGSCSERCSGGGWAPLTDDLGVCVP